MKSPEFSLPSRVLVEKYALPDSADWQSVDEVPEDFRTVASLHAMAEADGEYVETTPYRQIGLEELQDLYDTWNGFQSVRVARDEDRAVVGMLSYYIDSRNGIPFCESVGVLPEEQGSGVGSDLIDSVLEELSRDTTAPYAVAMAQARVAAIYERRWGAHVTSDDGKLVRMEIPLSR